MSRTIVHAGRRMSFTPTVNYKAGDLVYFNGFYGYIQDNVNAGDLGTLILDPGVVDLKNFMGNNLAMGTRVYAAPSAIATSLLLTPEGSQPSGARAVGRVWTTGPASAATALLRVLVFHPNAS